MADNDRKPDAAGADINPGSRESLRKAADELLKADRAARRRAAAEDADAYAAFEDQNDADQDEGAVFGDMDTDSAAAGSIIAEEIEAIQAENTDMKDRLLRLAADMENLRRRTQREVGDAKSYAIANFARDMLGVTDNLRRAIEAVTAEQREGADDVLKNLLEGVELTEKSMLSTMERHGVKQLAPEGERFDPNFHQAMFEVPNPEVPNNTVVQVVQAGYSIGERVLRPAMVGVAKGGPKQAATDAEPGPPNAEAEKDA
ncbi:MAG: nucleotide exchange factor GrpE [Phyllobacteriaceae bacterium]|jgi:molecular chaperone GrpE|nr:nucleotide exchange factor GrpE [Phyllobacteriaceae bacterium]